MFNIYSYLFNEITKDDFLLLILACGQSINSSRMFTANKKYAFVGRLIVNMDLEIKSAGSMNWTTNPRQLKLTYPVYNFQINFTVAMTIGSFQYKSTSNSISLFVRNTLNSDTYAIIHISTKNASEIIKLTINYLLYDNLIFKQSNFNFLYLSLAFSESKISRSYSPLVYLINTDISPNNSTNGINSISMISGINARSNQSYPFSIDVFTTLSSNSQNITYLTIGSNSDKVTILENLYILLCFYNPTYAASQSFYYIQNGLIFTYYQNSVSFKSKKYQITNFNVFIGLNSFSASTPNTFGFSQQISTEKGIFIVSNNDSNFFSFSFIVIMTNYCSYATPYYEPLNQLCYDICPNSSLANNYTLACECSTNQSLDFQKNNSKCIDKYITSNSSSNNSTQIQSTSIDKSQSSTLTGLIIGFAISMTILMISIYFVCKTKKMQDKQNQKKSNLQSVNNLRILQVFPKKQKDQFQAEEEINPSNQVQQKEIQLKQNQKWVQITKAYSYEQKCGLCLKPKAFLKILCSHTFHLSCLAKELKTNKGCPVCGKNVYYKARFFCNVCLLQYKVVQIKSRKIQINIHKKCRKCAKIPI